jgi:ATP-dependent RNA helicase RhlE
LTQFNELGLADPILRALNEAGYTQPTPIQAEAIPALLQGRDVLGIAQTGTGKTAAFVLPILHRLAGLNKRPAPTTCRALILSPTRELSAQIRENLQNYSAHMRLSSALVVGGLKAGPQVKVLARGVDVVVATPGRLLDLVKSRALSLSQVQTLVLDEADQMLDLGFFPAIREIVSMLPADRQTALLSATMPKPIKALAHDLLTDPKQISVAPVSRPIERIEQSAILTPQDAKRELLLEILSDKAVERAIVFTRTKRGADRVNKHLVAFGLKAAAIHGDKSQGQRVKALAGFKAGSVKILVATDIAARGIDVDDVSHVVNFELPNIPESYVHRIGRTARAGKTGVAVSLCDPSEYDYLRDIERLTGHEVDKAIVGEEADFLAQARAASGASKPKKSRNRRRGGGALQSGNSQAGHSRRPQADASGKPQRRRRTRRPKSAGRPQGSGVEAGAI